MNPFSEVLWGQKDKQKPFQLSLRKSLASHPPHSVGDFSPIGLPVFGA